jgi:hypothetical protein
VNDGLTGASAPNVTVVPGPKPRPRIVTAVPALPSIGTAPDGGCTTVTAGGTICSWNVNDPRSAPPILMLTVTVPLDVVTCAPALSTISTPKPPAWPVAVSVDGWNWAVTPDGSAPAIANETVPLMPAAISTFIGVLALPNAARTAPKGLVTADTPLVPSETFGAPLMCVNGLVTVIPIAANAAPATTRNDVCAAGAEAEAVSVSVTVVVELAKLEACSDAGENCAETPIGSPCALSATADFISTRSTVT